ncbi:Hypothetical predicted protein, partial [Pelobates cultripes]
MLTEGRLRPRLSFDSDLETTLAETKTQIEDSLQLLKRFSEDEESEDINIMKEMLKNQTDLLDRTHKTLSHMSKDLDLNVTNFDNLQRQITDLGNATDILWKATNQKDLDFTLKEEVDNEMAQRLSCENEQLCVVSALRRYIKLSSSLQLVSCMGSHKAVPVMTL